MSRLGDIYKNEIVDAMMKKFGYKNELEVPKLHKIVVNMGVGEAKENAILPSQICRSSPDRRQFPVKQRNQWQTLR